MKLDSAYTDQTKPVLEQALFLACEKLENMREMMGTYKALQNRLKLTRDSLATLKNEYKEAKSEAARIHRNRSRANSRLRVKTQTP
jgi:septal ring factor EnvC (AmiA/AmiB activator)